MKILDIPTQDYLVSTGAIGSVHLANPSTATKLSDVNINAVVSGASSTEREYRISGPQTTDKVYIRSSATFIDTSRAFNIFTGTRTICQTDAYSKCAFQATSFATLDTFDDRAVPARNDCSRFFTDHSAVQSCWERERTEGGVRARCFSTGPNCVVAGLSNHPPIRGSEMYVRQRNL